MIKKLKSPYVGGRKRGIWFKDKLEPLSLDLVLLYAASGSGKRASLFTDYTFGIKARQSTLSKNEIYPIAKAYSGLERSEILELDRWIKKNTLDKFGPVRSVPKSLVFEIAFEGILESKRHKAGYALRFPRILCWRRDKSAEDIDSLTELDALVSLIQN